MDRTLPRTYTPVETVLAAALVGDVLISLVREVAPHSLPNYTLSVAETVGDWQATVWVERGWQARLGYRRYLRRALRLTR